MKALPFEDTYQQFMEEHIARRKGERRSRLERGPFHAEKLFLQQVWFPLMGNLQHLHPEYEVMDWRGRSYFGDFAYLPGLAEVKFMLEVKGYGPHVQELDRKGYCDELNRETFLQALGFRVVSFAYDDVAYRPGLCMNLLQMLLGRFHAAASPVDRAVLAEKEILRLLHQQASPLRPVDVERHFGINHRTALRLLQSLCAKGWLHPISRTSGGKIVQYGLVRGVLLYVD
ncbi:hypothetical protein [Paenibacillus whitsoniae]|uniref:hypothetical protein n=1 Tax=Paenibacillus whitsoniae TaxID=2496558 RepID=UPI0026B520D0